MSDTSETQEVIYRKEYERFRYRVDKEIGEIKETHYKDKIEMLERINEQQISAVKVEEAMKNFTESVVYIRDGIEKMDGKMENIGSGMHESNQKMTELDGELKTLKVKVEKHIEPSGEQESGSNTSKWWWTAFFTFLGLVVPKIIEKTDVILDFFWKLKGGK